MNTPEPIADGELSLHAAAQTDDQTQFLRRRLIYGIVATGLGVALGAAALTAFCYSLGADFRSEGLTDSTTDSSGNRRIWMIVSLVLFSLAIPSFWIGFYQVSRPESHARSCDVRDS